MNPDLLAQVAYKENAVIADPLEKEDPEDLSDLRVLQAHVVLGDLVDLVDHVVLMVRLESLERTAAPVDRANEEQEARLENGESAVKPAVLDPLDVTVGATSVGYQ